MNKILVSGLINIETTLKIDSFPIGYSPIHYPLYGINATVSGVAVNVGKALKCLGDEVNVISLIGKDIEGRNVVEVLEKENISAKYLNKGLDVTPQAIVLYDGDGRRQIYADLKDIQEKSYPEALFNEAVEGCSIVALCNINFSRPFLKKAREANKIVATDVHVLSDIHDTYNADFMRYANILFMSHEKITGSIEDFCKKVINEYDNDILVVGLGAEGALLYVKEDSFLGRFEAVKTREIVNTVGAGDALFASFIHFYNKTRDPYTSLRKAIIFASYKIGARGAAEGFINERDLDELYKNKYKCE
ncbi:MAG: carbohydrate kinase family protein [Clostridia bacterium]|nr:carbohydrate kinase family protein [Clostridia bacterium]